MAHRDRGQGTFLIDLRLGKLGRLKRASGTTDVTLHRDIVALLRRLRRERRWDLLALAVNGAVTPLELCEAVWSGREADLPSAEDAQLLRSVISRWTATLDRAPRTVRDYKRMLLRIATDRARLSDLPRILKRERAQAMRTGHRSAFNHLYSAARMMLGGTLGEDHRLTKEARRIEALRLTDKRTGNPQSPEAIRTLAATLGKHAPTLWALCLTGMRRGEYWGRRFNVLTDRVAVRGTKSAAAVRQLPKVYQVALPTCEYRWFKKLLSDTTNTTVRVHDLRYTWMRWCEEAGVPEIRTRYYAGHAVKDVSELYRRGRGFAEHLAADAQRIREWLGDRGPAMALEVIR